MKRRVFLQNLGAAATAPVLPHGRILPTLLVSAADYAKAAKWAALWTDTTARMIGTLLDVDDATARRLFQRLQNDGVLGPTQDNGTARAVMPWFERPDVALRIAKSIRPRSVPARLETRSRPDRIAHQLKSPVKKPLDFCTRPRPRPKRTDDLDPPAQPSIA